MASDATKPDYDSLMAFLADTPVSQLKDLAKEPGDLEAYIQENYPSKPWGNVAPDSQESQDGATASGETSDQAEEKIYSLLETSPETWEAIKVVMEKIAEPAATTFFQRYYKPISIDEEPEDLT